MSWFHEVEDNQVGVLMAYDEGHPGARYRIEYAGTEAYICTYFTSYESENTGELDIEMDDPRYDEFYQIWMTVVEVVKDGPRRSEESVLLDYRDFPTSITDAGTGIVVYPAP